MISEATAYDMGERAAIHGLNAESILGMIALGWTDSESFCKVYEAFQMGEAQGCLILSKFGRFN